MELYGSLAILYLSYNGPGDEFFHDFIGPPIDGLHPRVKVGLADGVLGHEAPPAVELHALVSDLILELGTPSTNKMNNMKRLMRNTGSWNKIDATYRRAWVEIEGRIA